MFLIGTDDGIIRFDVDKKQKKAVGLRDHSILQVAASHGYIVAVADDGQLHEKLGKKWKSTRLGKHVSAESILIVDGVVYAGTQPTRVFRKELTGTEWKLVGALDELPMSAHFHTPWGGPAAIRSMAANTTGQIYLDIHVGGIVRTRDSGVTWETINHGLEEDVHEVATHPLRPERVYAATADGFYFSENEGTTWHRRNSGMPNLYCRGIAVHPRNPDIVLLSGSPFSPPKWNAEGPQFVLFRTENTGETWQAITDGLPNPSPDVIDTGCITFSQKQHDVALCGLRSGQLYVSLDSGVTWSESLKVKALNSVCWGG